jgi:hypothetical protein
MNEAAGSLFAAVLAPYCPHQLVSPTQQSPCPLAPVLSLQQPFPFFHPERSRGICGAPIHSRKPEGAALPLSSRPERRDLWRATTPPDSKGKSHGDQATEHPSPYAILSFVIC